METCEELAARVKVLESENSALSSEVDRLSGKLAQLDAREAARQKALAAGLTPEEIDKLKA